MSNRLRVLLAEDHNVVRAGLKALIDAQDDMRVVGESADGEAACRLCAELTPDVVVMDVSMPILGGVPATERICRDQPEVRVLILTVQEDRSYLHQLLRAGASGYLLKRAAADELIHAIRAVARGGTYVDPGLIGDVLGDLGARTSREGSPAEPLSEREGEVLRLVSRGFTNREIATQLDVSIKTVETHKARGMEKLGLVSRADIVAYAIRRGWLTST
ncbi:Oxygen regulatory protein NreC [Aquisphaera giovannonii]|uniref:Oxygen regulatory protein NreC n=1 Tax=Aquisphaera giovannonii TaxID=406548 RepID=A0A5B9WFH4_9BACT|nr:response regulator transcription factor [Aquisphaera giovannonii]QEH38721.1 Oxygen regulatory protein NreC [Aquisphaera giovannonii]